MGMRCGVTPGGLGEGEVGLLPPVRIPGSPWIEIYDAAITACQPHEMMERERRPMLTRTNLLYLPAVPCSCNKRTPRDLPPISAVAHSVEAKTRVGVPRIVPRLIAGRAGVVHLCGVESQHSLELRVLLRRTAFAIGACDGSGE